MTRPGYTPGRGGGSGVAPGVYLPIWQPNTAYAANAKVLNPNGIIVAANSAFTSGATYNAANWTAINGNKFTSNIAAPSSPIVSDLWGVPDVGPQSAVMGFGWQNRFFASDLALNDGDNVTTWNDGGSDAQALTVYSGNNAPTFRKSPPALNYRESIQWTAASTQRLQTATLVTAVGLPQTFVVIGQANADGQYFIDGVSTTYYRRFGRTGGKWLIQSSATSALSASGTSNSMPHLFIIEFASAASTLEIDGTQVIAPVDTGAQSYRGLAVGGQFGGQPGGYLDGYTSFVARINRLLTSTEKTQLRTWAKLFYGLSNIVTG